MFLEALHTAVPPHRYTQQQCLAALRETPAYAALKPRSQGLMEKILGNGVSGIATRSFCLPEIGPGVARDAQELNETFEREAPRLAIAALQPALEKAGIAAVDLDALFICTCTGYLCPGVTSHVAELLELRDTAYLQDLVGLGCGAAIPMLRSAEGFLAAHPGAKVATVAVEVCSAAFFADDDPGVLISLCLFGDGAAAAVWSDAAEPNKWQVGRFTTVHKPQQREKIRFVNAGGKLRNQLDKAVPGLAAEAVAELYAQRSADPDRILSHSGGRDVIDALEAVLPQTLDDTREVLRHHGNMSSPSVLFALDRALATANGDRHWWLTAFGAGFAAHACEMWK
ncbi:3-oxoacyl-[acyl-carrier-protein] synthase III C-terminal domain-containing protein [Haloferula sp. BvORR071]|uniref:type III polyketide synthase n=1 Tax=Haloferula sp. BvORR071 TaxID=1396141 RepID=UPI00054DA34D|nr:3-oxoacyl-[acyl-carrier-protein] synthase III C-terminal domain-containing protein [Haloferula sp. BvORR071]